MTAYTITLIPLIITLKVLFPKRNILKLFSLNKPMIQGFTLALTGTLPMLIGYLIHFKIIPTIHLETLFINTLSSALLKRSFSGLFLSEYYTDLPGWDFYHPYYQDLYFLHRYIYIKARILWSLLKYSPLHFWDLYFCMGLF